MAGDLEGDGDTVVSGVARLQEAEAGQLSFCALPEYRQLVARTGASALLVPRDFQPPEDAPERLALLRVDNPYLAVATAVRHFHPETLPERSIHPSAVVDASARIGRHVGVGAGAVIEAGVEIGENSLIGAGTVLAESVVIGTDCRVHANVTLYPAVRLGDRVILHAGVVLGADGFGYVEDGAEHLKIPQVGTVVVEDDVEIGANSCVDRAALGETRIARGTKIDNLVQIGHNCHVGANTVLCGQVGLGGSAVIGEGVMIGGQAGVGGHIRVGDGVRVAGGTGVTNSVSDGETVGGYPHMEISRWRRAMAALRSLPDLLRRVRRLEAALEDSKVEDE